MVRRLCLLLPLILSGCRPPAIPPAEEAAPPAAGERAVAPPPSVAKPPDAAKPPAGKKGKFPTPPDEETAFLVARHRKGLLETDSRASRDAQIFFCNDAQGKPFAAEPFWNAAQHFFLLRNDGQPEYLRWVQSVYSAAGSCRSDADLPDALVDHLSELLDMKNPGSAPLAICARMGPRCRKLLPKIRPLLDHEDTQVAIAARRAIKAIDK